MAVRLQDLRSSGKRWMTTMHSGGLRVVAVFAQQIVADKYRTAACISWGQDKVLRSRLGMITCLIMAASRASAQAHLYDVIQHTSFTCAQMTAPDLAIRLAVQRS